MFLNFFFRDLLRAEEPVITLHVGSGVLSAFYACSHFIHCTRVWINDFVTRTPVSRKGYTECVGGLQSYKYALDLIEITSESQRIVNYSADRSFGSMKNTARTAWVWLSPGCTIPYILATFIETSSISGNCMSIPLRPFQSIRAFIVLSHAIWLESPSIHRPTNWQLRSWNSFFLLPNVINSEVHTVVESGGWLNNRNHLQ